MFSRRIWVNAEQLFLFPSFPPRLYGYLTTHQSLTLTRSSLYFFIQLKDLAVILRPRLDAKNKQKKQTNGKQNYHRILLLLVQQSIILFRLVLSTASSFFMPKPTTRQYKDVYRPSYVPEAAATMQATYRKQAVRSRRTM